LFQFQGGFDMKRTNKKLNTAVSVTNRRDLKDCWIQENSRYIHTDELAQRLPYVKGDEVAVLQANHIPYRESQRREKEVFEYWDPECFEEEEVEAPLYVKMFGKYEYLGNTYKGTKLTKKTVKMAIELREQVISKKVEEYHQDRKLWKLWKEAKEALNGGLARYKEVEHTNYFKYNDIQMGDDHIRCFPITDAKRNYLKAVVFFDVSKIAKDSIVTVQVPEDMTGWIIGRDGRKISKWASEIGVERIQLAH